VFESRVGLDVFLFDRTPEVGELSLRSSTLDLSKLIWKLCDDADLVPTQASLRGTLESISFSWIYFEGSRRDDGLLNETISTCFNRRSTDMVKCVPRPIRRGRGRGRGLTRNRTPQYG